MKKVIFGTLAAVCLVIGGLSVTMQADPPAGQISLCHLPGHVGDWIVDFSTGKEGEEKACKEGVLITIDCNALSAHYGKDGCKKGD